VDFADGLAESGSSTGGVVDGNERLLVSGLAGLIT
jgi:hypothetical protein